MIITEKNVSMCNWRVQKVEQANYSKTFQNLITDLEKFACKVVQYFKSKHTVLSPFNLC